MKPIRSLALALALGCAASLGALSLAHAQADWQTVRATDGAYLAKLPGGTPAVPDTKSYNSNNGPVVVSSYRTEAAQGHYAVGTITYEKRLNRTPAQMLDDVRNGVVAHSRGTLASEKPVALQGAQGRELIYSVKNETGTYHVRQRFYVSSPNKIVQAAYVGTPGSENAPAVTQFLDSVSITKQ